MLILYLSLLDDNNEKQLFEKVYYSYRKQMRQLAKEFLLDDEDAEDVVHDVFLKVAEKYIGTIKKIENEKDLRNYMLKATKNTAINLHKKKTAEAILFNRMLEYDIEDMQDLSDDCFLDVLCEKIEYEQVLEAMNAMDSRYRDVLYYHFVLEFTLDETAKALERTKETTKKQLVRGKKILLRLLEEKG